VLEQPVEPGVNAVNETGAARRLPYPLLLLTVALGGIVAPLNSTMLAVALPELRSDFSIGHGAIGWLISAYLIAMAVAQPLGGRLGDQIGRARVFRAGLFAFVALSIAAAFSPTFPILVVLRTGQALVGAAVIPNGMAMLRESLPADRLGGGMGLMGATMSFAAAAGPLLGAVLLEVGSWRWLFLVNVPLVAGALMALAALRYPEPRERRPVDLDWRGAAAFGLVLTAVTVVLALFNSSVQWAVIVATFAGLLVTIIVFVQTQRWSTTPVVEWSLFRNRSYAGATSYVMLSNLVMYTTLVSIPFFVEEVQGRGTAASGLLLGAMSIVIAIMSPIGGRLSDSAGRRLPALAGSLVVVGAMIALLFGVHEDVSPIFLGLALGALGFGMGLSFGPASTAAIESVPRELAGTASGTNSMMRYVGSIVGVGILTAVLGAEDGSAEVGLFRAIFAVLLVMAVAASVTTLLIHQRLSQADAAGQYEDQRIGGPARQRL
jgi:EmrB/QacA subfamily drug resistance transporter